MKYMENINGDSDRVVDLGETKVRLLERLKLGKKHQINDTHDGKCKVYCPLTKHTYLHLINVPNKFALLCRGCGETI